MEFILKGSPLISVIMPVFNPGIFLKDAIDSILNQSFSNFEFIIINDASTDSSDSLIKSYADSRIVYRLHQRNLGIVPTLNEGIQLARGKYIARMDADDISQPLRFEHQVNFLDAHPDIAMVGSLFARIDSSNQVIQIEPVIIDPKLIKMTLCVKNCFCHGSIMINTRLVDKKTMRYSNKYPYVEDYHLWRSLSTAGYQLGNVPELLYYWRVHSSNITNNYASKQQDALNYLMKNSRISCDSWTISDLKSFINDKYMKLPDTIEIEHTNYNTNYNREVQFILVEWIKGKWHRRPFQAAYAIALVFFLAPLNIFNKILHAK